MILHISRDEKFLDSAISIFEEAVPKLNKYVIWKQDPKEKIPSLFYRFSLTKQQTLKSFPSKDFIIKVDPKYIVQHKSKITFAVYGTEQFFENIGNVLQYKAIIFHSLVYNQAKLAVAIRKKVRIPLVWCPFGYEVYNMLPEFKNIIYQDITSHKYVSNKTLRDRAFSILNYFKGKTVRSAIKKMDYCALAIKDEYDLYREVIGINAKLNWFSYYPLDRLIKDQASEVKGKNILLGNSSSPSNNHFEALDFLAKHDIENRTIIAPLSYGDKKYGKIIKKEGTELFGRQFRALTEFLPITEYNDIVMSCDIVIMNHNRQEAFGNILTALVFGASVYLNESNTIFKYLNNCGIKVFAINNLNTKQSKAKLQTLSADDIINNRKIVAQLFSFENIVRETKAMISEVTDPKN